MELTDRRGVTGTSRPDHEAHKGVWQCNQCDCWFGDDEPLRELTIHDDARNSASGRWCSACWPFVEAKLYVMLGMAAEA